MLLRNCAQCGDLFPPDEMHPAPDERRALKAQYGFIPYKLLHSWCEDCRADDAELHPEDEE